MKKYLLVGLFSVMMVLGFSSHAFAYSIDWSGNVVTADVHNCGVFMGGNVALCSPNYNTPTGNGSFMFDMSTGSGGYPYPKDQGSASVIVSGLTVPPSGFVSMISSAQTSFTDTLGFPETQLVAWSGSKIMIMLGGGLGLVNALIGWIIALIIIMVIVRLIFHGLRFLHILK